MGLCFHWFRDYQIIMQDETFTRSAYCSDVVLNGGDNTSYGYGRAGDLKELFYEVTKVEFPVICTYAIHSETDDIGLIDPDMMVRYCDTVLSDERVDELGIRDILEFFKELSEQGYYLAFEYE